MYRFKSLPNIFTIHIYIGLVGRVFANGPAGHGSILGRDIPKT